MKNDDKIVPLDVNYAINLYSQISGSNNLEIVLEKDKIPANANFPSDYMKKVDYVTCMTSACSEDDSIKCLIAYNRNDSNEIDQDLLLYCWNSVDATPSVSATRIYHGDYLGRTTDYSATNPILEQKSASGKLELSECAKKAFDYAGPYFKKLKDKIESCHD